MTNYNIKIHKEAKKQLNNLPPDHRERVTDTIVDVSKHRKPTDHSKCKVLNNNYTETLYKIRIGEYRVLAKLEKPNLKIMKVGERNGFYRDIDGVYSGM